MNHKQWVSFGRCYKCQAEEGWPCSKLHVNPDGTIVPTGIWCVNPHQWRRLRVDVVALESARTFGITLQHLDVECDITDHGCGAEAGEKCRAEDWQEQGQVHGARERRAMYVKHMWRAWN